MVVYTTLSTPASVKLLLSVRSDESDTIIQSEGRMELKQMSRTLQSRRLENTEHHTLEMQYTREGVRLGSHCS